jgi:hypothetical protein
VNHLATSTTEQCNFSNLENCFNGFVSNTGKHVREKEKPARPPYYFFSPCYNRRSIKQIASSLLNFEKGE